MRLNYLDSIGYCKALCQDTGTIVTGRLVYFGAGRYCLQQGVDLSLNGDTYTAFRTDNIFINITRVSLNGTPCSLSFIFNFFVSHNTFRIMRRRL